jgi:hypothetical protein
VDSTQRPPARVIPAQAGTHPPRASFPRRREPTPHARHSRAGGNPFITRTPLDSRLRGNDEQIAALDAESVEVLGNIKVLL